MKNSFSAKKQPMLIVVSAPSGAGKSTLCDRILAERKDIIYSVSCTTRAPRGNEQNGIDYNFMTPDDFRRRVDAGDFLEYASVHDNFYGTLKESVQSAMDTGHSVIMDIDVQGAAQVREALKHMPPDDPMALGFVDIFIMPPSIDVLRERLEGRGEDAPEVIQRRLQNAAAEMERAGEYRYQIVNDDLERALDEMRNVLNGGQK